MWSPPKPLTVLKLDRENVEADEDEEMTSSQETLDDTGSEESGRLIIDESVGVVVSHSESEGSSEVAMAIKTEPVAVTGDEDMDVENVDVETPGPSLASKLQKELLVSTVQDWANEESGDGVEATEEELDTQGFNEIPTNLLLNHFQRFQRGSGESDDDDDDDEDEDDAFPICNDAFTGEEVVAILKSKLSKLHAMYEDQFEDLKDEYKEKRAQFLKTKQKLKKSKIPFTSNPNVLTKDPENGITEEFIKGQHFENKYKNRLLNYKRDHGPRAVVYAEAAQAFEEIEKKEEDENASNGDGTATESASEGGEVDMCDSNGYFNFCEEIRSLKIEKRNIEPASTETCLYKHNSKRCQDPPLPLAKYCSGHILEDPRQALFKACHRVLGSGAICDYPILSIVDRLGCDLHHTPVVVDLSEGDLKKAKLDEAKALPAVENGQKKLELLEKLVTDEAISVNHMKNIIKTVTPGKLEREDTEDSEEEEDETAGSTPGPAYMTITL